MNDRDWQGQRLKLAQRMHMVGIRQQLPAQVCQERAGPTPLHPEPGRETVQRRGYWGDDSLGDEVDAPVLTELSAISGQPLGERKELLRADI